MKPEKYPYGVDPVTLAMVGLMHSYREEIGRPKTTKKDEKPLSRT